MRQLAPKGITAAFLEDVETQRLQLFPEDPALFQRVVSELKIEIPDYIEVQSTPLVRRLEYDVYGSGDISYSGSTDNCTGGFNVTDGNVRGLSTAGHCSTPPPAASTHRGQPIGTLMPQISLVEDGNGLDVSWYRNPSFNYPNIVRKSSTVLYTITAAFAAPPAKYNPTCVLPRASPEACDEVFDYVYWYKGGTTVASDGPYVVTKGYQTAPKDSGSPWMYNGCAHGIHSGSVVWAGATRSFYSPVSSLSKLGLRVVTTP